MDLLKSYHGHINSEVRYNYETVTTLLLKTIFKDKSPNKYADYFLGPFPLNKFQLKEFDEKYFKEKIEKSSLADYYKLYFYYQYGLEEYKKYLVSSMETFRESDEQDLKNKIMEVIYRVRRNR